MLLSRNGQCGGSITNVDPRSKITVFTFNPLRIYMVAPDRMHARLVHRLKGPLLSRGYINLESSGWTHIGGNVSSKRYNHTLTDRFIHDASGTVIRVTGPKVISVEFNPSRLFTGNKHNGYLVKSQAEYDLSLTKLWTILDQVSNGNCDLEYTSAEVGGVIEEPFSTFENLLYRANLPGKSKAPFRSDSTSLRFGTAKRSPLQVKFYDKGLEMGIGRGQYTRIEVVLSGKELRKSLDQEPVTFLDYGRLQDAFYQHVYSLDPESEMKSYKLDGSIAELLAMIICGECQYGGTAIIDRWAATKERDHARKTIKKARKIREQLCGQTLRELLPNNPPIACLDLTKVR